MKKAILALGLAGITFTSLFAEKIGVVDAEVIFQKYSKAQENEKRIADKIADAKKFLTERQTALSKLGSEAEALAKDAQNPTLTEAARATKKSEFQVKVQAFDAARQELAKTDQQIGQGIQQSRVQLQQDVIRELREKSAVVAKEKGLDLVVPAGATFYSADSLDVTQDVLKKLNESYAANPVTPSAPVSAPDAPKPAGK